VVGQPGGIVAVPIDATGVNAPIAGFSVTIPSGLMSTPTAISLEPADSFVAGDDTPAGNAVRILPETLAFTGDVEVHVGFQLPPGVDGSRLALFQKRGTDVTVGLGVSVTGAFLSHPVREFGVFQAGVQAPPRGTPDGTYHVQTLLLTTLGDPDPVDPSVLQSALVISHDYTFAPTLTGSRTLGPSVSVSRQLVAESPNHIDGGGSSFSSSGVFSWESISEGRFRFTFNEGTLPIDVEGVASDDGSIIAFTGRGEDIELFAVGVRGSETAVAATDLDGRWQMVELGVSLLGGDATPFSTRYTSAFRTFTADGVDTLTFDSAGTRYHSDLTYNTQLPSGEHTSSVSAETDGGTEDFTVQFNGQLAGDTGPNLTQRRGGWLNPAAGVLITTRADVDAMNEVFTLSLGIAVRQPGGAQAGAFDGEYHFGRFDLDVLTAAQPTTDSSLEILPVVGVLDAQPGGSATLTTEDAVFGIYSVFGQLPLNDMTWSVTRNLPPIQGDSIGFQLAPDANGNHQPVSGARWYGVSEDGEIVIGTTSGEAGQSRRGIFLGVK
jgi:hypothetical protein